MTSLKQTHLFFWTFLSRFQAGVACKSVAYRKKSAIKKSEHPNPRSLSPG